MSQAGKEPVAANSPRPAPELPGARVLIDFDLPAFPDGLIVNTDGEVEVVGGEFVLNARLGTQVKVTFDYTYTKAELDNDGDQIQDIPESLTKLIVEPGSERVFRRTVFRRRVRLEYCRRVGAELGRERRLVLLLRHRARVCPIRRERGESRDRERRYIASQLRSFAFCA